MCQRVITGRDALHIIIFTTLITLRAIGQHFDEIFQTRREFRLECFIDETNSFWDAKAIEVK